MSWQSYVRSRRDSGKQSEGVKMDELWRLSARAIAALVRARDVSATEVARAAIARLEAINPSINAVVDSRPEDTLARAAQIDAALASGEDVGPLAGVPVTVKVNIDQAGFATTNGVRLQKDLIANENSPVVDSLLAAGAIILGRTNTPAFSYRWFTTNLIHGNTRNPRDPSLTPGGSSGGAAAAVATGIGHIAQGTDIAGSIRYPAYACGVHGLRPSLGRVAAFNAASPERSIGGQIMAVAGPLARSIGDLKLGLSALARGDARDPWWVPAPLEGPLVARRVALCFRPGKLDTSKEVIRALGTAAACLEHAGWQVEEVADLPPLDEAVELHLNLWLADGFADKLADAEKEGDPGALTVLHRHEALGRALDLASLSSALTRHATLVRRWQLFLEQYPVVLMPVSGELPFENGLDLRDAESFERVWRAQTPQIGIPFLGLPALAVAVGSEGRIPVGVQIVSARFREDLCLAAGEAIEAGGEPLSPIDPASSDDIG
jgi:amidase